MRDSEEGQWGPDPELSVGKYGELVTDAEGRPHMAYTIESSIYYHGCESDCDTSEPARRDMVVENAALLSETDLVIPSTRAALLAIGASSGPR